MAETKSSGLTVTQMGTEAPPSWVREMQAHYTTTGAFRMEDVHRMLGDQRTCVGVAANQSLSASALMGKK